MVFCEDTLEDTVRLLAVRAVRAVRLVAGLDSFPMLFSSRLSEVGLMGEVGSQLSSQVQTRHPTRVPEGSDELHVEEHSSESTVGNKAECTPVITRIHATNVAIRLRRIPVGFYVAVKTETGIKRTLNKPASVGTGKDVVEWDDEIVLPSDRSSRIFLTTLASFELGSTLGKGEALCEFETTVGELVDRHEQSELITLMEQSSGEVISSRSSFEIKIELRAPGLNQYAAGSNPVSEGLRQLAGLTDMGHQALIRYREHQEQQDLHESVNYFELARDMCLPNHPSRATVLFNLATAKLMGCRVNDVSSNLDVPINLYRDVLHLRPRGHPDHPFTLLSLGIALVARFQRQRDEASRTEGKALLLQVLDIAPADGYVYLAAALALGSIAQPQLIQPTEIPKTIERDLGDEGGIQRLDSALQRISHEDSCKHVLLDHLGVLFCIRFNRLVDLGNPEMAISMLEVVVQVTSDDHPEKSSWMDVLGTILLTRHVRFGDRVDLEKSISVFEAAVRLTPDEHPDMPVRLDNLGSSLLTRYQRFGDIADLERSVSLRDNAVQFTLDGHPNKPTRLNNLGESMLTRHQCSGDISDLEKSISLFEVVVQCTPDDHPDKPQRLNNLTCSLLSRYDRFRNIADLERSISFGEDTLRFTPNGHSDKPKRLSNLGDSLLARYERFENVTDLERSISLFEDAVQCTPDGHPDKHMWLNGLAYSLWSRYQCFGNVANLERSISLGEDTLQLTPDGHPYNPRWLNNLGHWLLTRYQHFGDAMDLDKSISLLEDAVKFAPDGHPDKPIWLGNLAGSLSSRYQRLGDVTDLERSISSLEDAVQFAPDDHPDKPLWQNDLGNSLSTRFEHCAEVVDLERSISLFEDVVQFTPDGHPDKPMRLGNLAGSLSSRYERLGDVTDLERSISSLEDAVQFTPDDHPDKSLWQNNLSHSLSTRYKHFGDVTDLERSISLSEDAVKSTPDGHPDKPTWLNTLGTLLSTHYQRFGDTANLERSISLLEDVVQFTPDGHPDKPAWLNNLSDSLSTRHERFGDVTDLERSISLLEDAVQFTPDDHPDKPQWQHNLASSLLSHYQLLGNVAILERSISLSEDAMQFTPDGHPEKPTWLNNLGNLLLIHYQRFGAVTNLERSISLMEDAVQITPHDHPDMPFWLNSLACSLWDRYQHFGNVVDLERSISLRENSLQLTPDGHPEKPKRLNNLANSLSTSYQRFGNVTDLERSISLLEDAVPLVPDDHPDKSYCLNSLAHSLSDRYQRLGNIVDLERSVSLREDIMQFIPDGHPYKPLLLDNLARGLLRRFQHSGDLPSSDLSRAVLCSSRAARSLTGRSLDRFQASQTSILCARLLRHDSQSLLDAYTCAVDLLPQLAWIGLSLHDRYHQLLQAADAACDAASAALEVHKPELAVEWLEQGRSIVWSQLSQLRAPFDDLRAVYPDLAAQFERVSHELEQASAGDSEVNGFMHRSHTVDGSLEKQARQHHELALAREKLLAEIRALPNFERFLLPKTFKQLSAFAHSGPVVFLNASEYRCDALVVMAGSENVVHVPLSNTTYDEVSAMQRRLKELLRLQGRVVLRGESERGARVKGVTPDDTFRSILSYLWEEVVSPILDILPLSTSGAKLPRIFWCPTGPFSFLPIHAAGLYTTNPGPKLSDFAISSYIPTMSALALPPMHDLEATSRNIRLLAVPQPSTDGQRHLTGVRGEMETIRQLASSSPFVGFQEADGTVEDVLSKMTETDWVHFACHGTQDRADPLDSGFLLADGKRLKLPDVVRLSRPRGGLAFLSACHTATGDEQLSEEAIHIAAGMLLAGYAGVIATMWSILDDDAPRVTEDVYKRLFSDGGVPDGRQAAEALHHAIERLRDSGASFLSWVPFIHVGL